jgi:SAM-dependent methyltransferase
LLERDGWQDYELGAYVHAPDAHYALLQHVLGLHPTGTALEFGVGKGQSTRLIAHQMPVIGFDSFQGLPEFWREEPGERFDVGAFNCPPPVIRNSRLVIGLFADPLPTFDFAALDYIGLVHFDADLYSSTATALNHVEPHLRPGCYLVFDEWHGFHGAGPDVHPEGPISITGTARFVLGPPDAWRQYARVLLRMLVSV